MLVRLARPHDAESIADVVRRSIQQLCAADHRGDALVLARWLQNKTPTDVLRWLGCADRSVFVVEAEGVGPLGAGLVMHQGAIELNYVSPDARFRGVSKLLVHHMEGHLLSLGRETVTLISSSTARRFYRDLGYVERGAVQSRFGTVPGTLMIKDLKASSGVRCERSSHGSRASDRHR